MSAVYMLMSAAYMLMSAAYLLMSAACMLMSAAYMLMSAASAQEEAEMRRSWTGYAESRLRRRESPFAEIHQIMRRDSQSIRRDAPLVAGWSTTSRTSH